MPDVKHIFVSYSHLDDDLSDKVVTHLKGLDQFVRVSLWIDHAQIRVGDRWGTEIDKALAQADLAVLLISPAFLGSKFITEHELPRLLKRREEHGLRLVPLLLKPCAWPEWLGSTEIRPRGDLSLAEIAESKPAKVDRKLKELVEELARLLDPHVATPETDEERAEPVTTDAADRTAAHLLAATLLVDVPDELRAGIAARLVREIGRHTGLAQAGLRDAVRFFVEWSLLRTDEPTSPEALQESLSTAADNERARALVNRLRQSGRSGDFSRVPLDVNSHFFSRTNERAAVWKRYFVTVEAQGEASKEAVTSLVPVRVTMGFLAPQFLVAGLLSRLDDDWRPVLNAYQRAIPNPRQRQGAYESLQASQWNCWLMWGPSIPICSCEQWRGFVALQYGYGDENNSIPVVELAADEHGVPRALGPVVASLRGERRGARFTVLTGRLRWGPWFLGPYGAAPTTTDESVDLSARDTLQDEVPTHYGIAAAQRSLYAHRHDSDGLVFQLERVDESQPETRVYFSAYLWLMFLVARPSAPPAGPALLRGKRYPVWIDDDDVRERSLRDARLWEDLLPVFVHANIGDPDALRFQRELLVRNALSLLRQLWERRQELFDRADVEAGIQFHLVCGSDYAGCGSDVRFPPQQSLVEALRHALAAESDPAFAASVVLPRADDPARADELAGFFSSCHLPELIAAYYDDVSQSRKAPPRT